MRNEMKFQNAGKMQAGRQAGRQAGPGIVGR
jgi:hypothetical protein